MRLLGPLLVLALLAPLPAFASQPVMAAALRAVVWRQQLDVSATVEAEQSAVLAAQQPGRVTAVLFRSGQAVAAGTLLVQFDNATQLAQLALDGAKQAQARRSLAREQKLMSIAGASQAALEEAQAGAAEAAAQLAFDAAALAQLQVVAPFAGTLGIRKISAGDYLTQGEEVARITQLAPLRVMFSVPQTQSGTLAIGDNFVLNVPALPNPVTGHITALSPQIDQASNARDVEGAAANPDGALLPGMYGVASLQTGPPQPGFAAPATALNDSILGRYVFVLHPAPGGGFTLQTVYVQELSQSGATAVVSAAGLVANEKVVARGGANLTDGASVTILQ